MSGTTSGGNQQTSDVDAAHPNNLGPQTLDAGADKIVSEPPSPMDYSPEELDELSAAESTGTEIGQPAGCPHPGAGHFGVGSNLGPGNDSTERETEPGYQRDKGDRGTLMPR